VHYPASRGVSIGESAVPASLVDLVPTVLDVVGLDGAGAPLHGRSLLELGSEEGAAERAIHADHQLRGDELASVRVGPYKLVVDLRHGTRELRDTRRAAPDGDESQLRVEDPARAERLYRHYRRYVGEADAWSAGLASQQRIDPEELEERLRAMGYVE
jgi:arylsulfatase A-like enzyme